MGIACACAIVYRPLFNWVFRAHVPAAGSALPGKRSRPSAGGIGYPKVNQQGWEDVAEDEYKMLDVPESRKGKVDQDEIHS